jgi:hypothetical protein
MRKNPGSGIVPASIVSGVVPTVEVDSVRRQHFRPDAVLYCRAGSLVPIAHDVDAKPDRLADVVGPARPIRRHRHRDAAERLARRLRERHGDEACRDHESHLHAVQRSE